MNRKLLYVSACLLCSFSAEARLSRVLDFQPTDSLHRIETVTVTNLMNGQSVTVGGDESVELTDDSLSGIDGIETSVGLKVTVTNLPDGGATLTVDGADSSPLTVGMWSADGRMVAAFTDKASRPGRNAYRVDAPAAGVYLLSVGTDSQHTATRFVAVEGGEARIVRSASGSIPERRTVGQTALAEDAPVVGADVMLFYHDGDVVRVEAESAGMVTLLTLLPSQSQTVKVRFVDCRDGSGASCPVAKIGGQYWSVEPMESIGEGVFARPGEAELSQLRSYLAVSSIPGQLAPGGSEADVLQGYGLAFGSELSEHAVAGVAKEDVDALAASFNGLAELPEGEYKTHIGEYLPPIVYEQSSDQSPVRVTDFQPMVAAPFRTKWGNEAYLATRTIMDFRQLLLDIVTTSVFSDDLVGTSGAFICDAFYLDVSDVWVGEFELPKMWIASALSEQDYNYRIDDEPVCSPERNHPRRSDFTVRPPHISSLQQSSLSQLACYDIDRDGNDEILVTYNNKFFILRAKENSDAKLQLEQVESHLLEVDLRGGKDVCYMQPVFFDLNQDGIGDLLMMVNETSIATYDAVDSNAEYKSKSYIVYYRNCDFVSEPERFDISDWADFRANHDLSYFGYYGGVNAHLPSQLDKDGEAESDFLAYLKVANIEQKNGSPKLYVSVLSQHIMGLDEDDCPNDDLPEGEYCNYNIVRYQNSLYPRLHIYEYEPTIEALRGKKRRDLFNNPENIWHCTLGSYAVDGAEVVPKLSVAFVDGDDKPATLYCAGRFFQKSEKGDYSVVGNEYYTTHTITYDNPKIPDGLDMGSPVDEGAGRSNWTYDCVVGRFDEYSPNESFMLVKAWAADGTEYGDLTASGTDELYRVVYSTSQQILERKPQAVIKKELPWEEGDARRYEQWINMSLERPKVLQFDRVEVIPGQVDVIGVLSAPVYRSGSYNGEGFTGWRDGSLGGANIGILYPAAYTVNGAAEEAAAAVEPLLRNAFGDAITYGYYGFNIDTLSTSQTDVVMGRQQLYDRFVYRLESGPDNNRFAGSEHSVLIPHYVVGKPLFSELSVSDYNERVAGIGPLIEPTILRHTSGVPDSYPYWNPAEPVEPLKTELGVADYFIWEGQVQTEAEGGTSVKLESLPRANECLLDLSFPFLPFQYGKNLSGTSGTELRYWKRVSSTRNLRGWLQSPLTDWLLVRYNRRQTYLNPQGLQQEAEYDVVNYLRTAK